MKLVLAADLTSKERRWYNGLVPWRIFEWVLRTDFTYQSNHLLALAAENCENVELSQIQTTCKESRVGQNNKRDFREIGPRKSRQVMLNNLNYQNSKKWIFYHSSFLGFGTVLWPHEAAYGLRGHSGFKFELLDLNYICSQFNLPSYCDYFQNFELVWDRSWYPSCTSDHLAITHWLPVPSLLRSEVKIDVVNKRFISPSWRRSEQRVDLRHIKVVW